MQIMKKARWLRLSGVLACCLRSGRSESQPENQRVVVPVSGRVTFRGEPIQDAYISLHPVTDPTDGLPLVLPRAKSAADGTFQLATYQTGDGAPIGEYQVAVSWEGPLQGLTEAKRDQLTELLPLEYTYPAASGLTVRVDEVENNLQEFVLTLND